MEMKEDKSHDTDRRLKQEHNHSAAYFGRRDGKKAQTRRVPSQTSNKLLQRGGQCENPISPHLCHLLSTNDAVFVVAQIGD